MRDRINELQESSAPQSRDQFPPDCKFESFSSNEIIFLENSQEQHQERQDQKSIKNKIGHRNKELECGQQKQTQTPSTSKRNGTEKNNKFSAILLLEDSNERTVVKNVALAAETTIPTFPSQELQLSPQFSVKSTARQNQTITASATLSTDAVLTRVDEIRESLYAIRIQTSRLKNSIAEFADSPHQFRNTKGCGGSSKHDCDTKTHGMWNIAKNETLYDDNDDTTAQIAQAVIAEKIAVLRSALRDVNARVIGLGDGLGSWSATSGVAILVQFHRRKLARDFGDCAAVFKEIVEMQQRGQLRTFENNDAGESNAGWIIVGVDGRLESMVKARTELELEIERERELKNMENGMSELVDMFSEMRHIVELQDGQFDMIVTSLEHTDASIDNALQQVGKTVEKRRSSRITCWWWTGAAIIFHQRIGIIAAGIVLGLLGLRDVWQICVVMLGGPVTRYQLYLRWRLKTFHVETATTAELFEPWGVVLCLAVWGVVQSSRRRGLVRYVVAGAAAFLLLRWVIKDILAIHDAAVTFNHHIDAAHSLAYAQHHAEAIVPAQLAKNILKRVEDARKVANAENSTDHDWLHAMRGVNYPIVFMPPDYFFAFPWSFVFLFLAGLAASALRHRYSLHWSPNGRIRFVKRYPDPEETESNDTWDTLVDNPDLDPAALSLAEQFDAKLEATRLLQEYTMSSETATANTEAISIAMEVPKAEKPIALFPIKDPNESQIAIGDQLREKRDFQRKMTRRLFIAVFFLCALLDILSIQAVYSLKSRIQSGSTNNPNLILVVDLGFIPDNYTASETLPQIESDNQIVDPATNLTKAKGAIDSSISFQGTKHGATPRHFPQRPPPTTRPWVPEYPLPISSFLLIVVLIKLALPPLFAPRVRLRLYKDKLVAIPLTYPVQYRTIHFADVVAIEIKGEETPSGTLFLRHRKYVKLDGGVNRARKFKSVRGYLYSGLGDLGRSAPEDNYLVMLRTRESADEWGVQVQGMSVERLRDVLDAVISEYYGLPPSVAGIKF
ncbi:hypothetical protein HK100_007043 [Physocladia obscura]|uniref:t-SNARE coiled-coil homology domain-containing protein n=1 Tax=Physocladia obscura TaxID=109957 RepID=A0AAD5XKM2_9FUNG|nr:hypothetical protein HK100_007043 [Physocladia obscura]